MTSQLASAPTEIAFVTGAGSGIGRATAQRLASRGAALALLDLDRDALASLVAELGTDRVLALPADVSSATDVEDAVAATITRFGRLDTVVANAGIEVPGEVTSLPLDRWERALAINVTGVFLTARSTIKHLEQSPNAAFVAVASDAGLRGAQGWPAYAATKHAVIGLIKSMALDHGPAGVRVNAVCPGWVHTPLLDRVMREESQQKVLGNIPLGRLATPDDVAAVITHLSSPDSRHTNGMAYLMDGGEMAGGFRVPRRR
ncbi:SDR family NAD(P)-dependent oxidoreductase [Rhodococcus koreensis]